MKQIPGHPNYSVTEDGKVFSHLKDDFLKPWKGTNGYWMCGITLEKHVTVHSLVAITYIGPRPKKMDIRHLDGNKMNNHISNLKYGTRRENMLDRSVQAKRYKTLKLLPEQVMEIKQDKSMTYKQIAAKYGVSYATVNSIKTGNNWKWLTSGQ